MLPKHLKKRGICPDWSTVRLKKWDMLQEAIKVKMPTVTWGLNVEVILSISSMKSGTISVLIIVPSPVSADM